MKKAYKDLQKNLKNSFDKLPGTDYSIAANARHWIKQHCKNYTDEHFVILCKIYGSIFYPYQKKDRKVILKYLKNHKFKDFSKEFMV
jgi:hypothetical protein